MDRGHHNISDPLKKHGDKVYIDFVFQRLSSDCTEEIRSLVKETAMNINLDPVLMKACKEEVRSCSNHSLCSSDSTEEIRSLVKETAMNINLDPVLIKACKEEVRSCSNH